MTERTSLDAGASQPVDTSPAADGRDAPGLPAQRGRPDRLRRGVPAPARAAAAADALAGPGRAEGRPAQRQARPVGRFADYREYTHGDDLRQLDWNVYARLERLFVKLFIEEEDVTVTLLVDASASMATGRPSKLVFAKRAAAALGYIGLASEDRVAVSALAGRAPAGGRRCAAPGGCSGCSPTCRRSSRPPARPTSSRLPARGRPAPRSWRDRARERHARPGRRPRHPRAGRHRLGADRPASCRPTSSTRRSRATCGWSTPRPATRSTSPPI